jgi:hypothetical protein
MIPLAVLEEIIDALRRRAADRGAAARRRAPPAAAVRTLLPACASPWPITGPPT